MKYKHGDKVYNWRYKYVVEYVPNGISGVRVEYKNTGEKVRFGIPYRFRAEAVPGVHRYSKHIGKKCGGNAKGTPWKKAFVGDQIYQREIRDEYNVTFKMPDKIPYKYGGNDDRSWKRTKKAKQWMKGNNISIRSKN